MFDLGGNRPETAGEEQGVEESHYVASNQLNLRQI